MTKWLKVLTQKQIDVIHDIKENKPRHVIFEGAVRSGKTYLGIWYWVSIVSRSKGKMFIMTGQTISSLKRNVLDDIQRIFEVDTHLNINNEFEMYGNRIACFGSDKSDSYKTMHGLTAAGWYANEVTLSHQNTILEAFARCSVTDAKIIWETNPDKATHYIKNDYINRSGEALKDGSKNIVSYHFKLEDNTFLDDNYIDSLKQSIPLGTYFDRMILGLWKASDKAVYNNYKVTAERPKVIDEYCYGLDFGWTNQSALTKVMWQDGEVWVEGLMYESRLEVDHIIQRLERYIEDKDVPIYCDHDLDKIASIRKAGFNAIAADKGPGSVINGINEVRRYKVHALSTDVNLVHEIENYENKSNANGEVMEEPIKFKDHYMDSFRMAVYTHSKRAIDEIHEIAGDTYEEFRY